MGIHDAPFFIGEQQLFCRAPAQLCMAPTGDFHAPCGIP